MEGCDLIGVAESRNVLLGRERVRYLEACHCRQRGTNLGKPVRKVIF